MSEFGKQLELHHQALVVEITQKSERIATETEELRQLQLKLESVLELMKIEGVAPPTAQRHFIEAAHDRLLEKGRCHYIALAHDLREAGVYIPGLKPEANLLAHMSRDVRFEKVGRGVYAVVGDSGKHKRENGRRETVREPSRRKQT
jgi:hypothetical protein